jgi:hypothetical protein
MDRLQREAFFMGDAEYAQFIQTLPPNQRSFGQSLPVEYQEPESSSKRA